MNTQRGIVLSPADLDGLEWPAILIDAGLNLLGLHSDQLTAEQRRTVDRCVARGIDVEYHLHLSPRFMNAELFAARPEYFSMDILGQRAEEANVCVSSPGLLDLARESARQCVANAPATTHRYHLWAGDNRHWCNCEQCAAYSPSDQNVMLMHEFLDGARLADPRATVAYLAYLETLPAPTGVQPRPGVFLEFAPYRRNFMQPIEATACDANRKHVAALDALLAVFPARDACVLEYWLDVSYWSNYQKDASKPTVTEAMLASDIAFYVGRGFTSIASFACRMNEAYFSRFGDGLLAAFGRGCL